MLPIIRLTNLTKTYRLGDEVLRALDGVNLEVEKGQYLAITGPSGSGKSTLASIISGLDTPSEGRVEVDGEDLSHLRDNQLSSYRNRKVGFIFQSFNLQAHETALENVMMPLVFAKIGGRERAERAKACLEAVGLGDRLRHKPDQLSGGQRQRVAVARALANNPSIILADEPTGNLDSQKGEEIMKLLTDLHKQGITLLVITHDLNIAKHADRVVEIRDGHLSEKR